MKDIGFLVIYLSVLIINNKNMKKIYLLVPVLILVFSMFSRQVSADQDVPKYPYDLACVQTALEVRENAIIGVHDAFNADIKTALTQRLSSLKLAWAKTERKDRMSARNAAWNAYKESSIQAKNTLKSGKKKTGFSPVFFYVESLE